MLAVPQRLEQAVGEPERHDVLDGLLPKEMIDPIDLVLLRVINRMGRAFGATLGLGRAYSGVQGDTDQIDARLSLCNSALQCGKFALVRGWQISPLGGV
jgi:hypothetical protein